MQRQRMKEDPEPDFAHLLRLSDDTGLFEHARGAVPRRAEGYCLDDVARGLMVICREPDPGRELLRLSERYLAFVTHAQAPDGGFHNRLTFDRRWSDEPGVGDWWGRALWALGTAAARSPLPWLRAEALAGFELGARRRSRWPRSMAFAALGAAEVLTAHPGHVGARRLLGLVGDVIGPSTFDERWPWPEPRLTYANAALAEALIVTGCHLERPAAQTRGLRLLTWLLEHETLAGHLSVTGVAGAARGQFRPSFDQQPIEAAALADACATAFAVTGDPRWQAGVRLCVDWFLGDNDTRTVMRDPVTGGCHDGLTSTGRNANQGAESAIALLTTLQHSRRMG
jgi:hypothetical protein